MKSRILQRLPGATVLDLTHEITPYYPEEAGYWLYCVHAQFPRGTVHVAVVDPGVGSRRPMVVLEAFGQRFVAPDNGLLGLVAAADPRSRAHRLEARALSRLGLALESATFHGRDVFAPVGAELAAGRCGAAQLGPPCHVLPGRLSLGGPSEGGRVVGQVAAIDHFGNVLTTIRLRRPRGSDTVAVRLGRRRLRLVRTYGEAAPGECVALINSACMLEIAGNQTSASARLNARPGQAVELLNDGANPL